MILVHSTVQCTGYPRDVANLELELFPFDCVNFSNSCLLTVSAHPFVLHCVSGFANGFNGLHTLLINKSQNSAK